MYYACSEPSTEQEVQLLIPSEPSFDSSGRLKSSPTLNGALVLLVVSLVVAGIAYGFAFTSFVLGHDVLAANPYCEGSVTVLRHVQPILMQLYAAWLISGVSGVLSLFCAFRAHRVATETPQATQRAARFLLKLSSFALFGLVASFFWFQFTHIGMCVA